ncbi:putative palmitoyl-CoA hydrolase [Helianthus debilis subsp. tardiflorus]
MLRQLTCLLLPHEHCSLLQSKSIWNTEQTCTLVERILHLDSIDALAAASKTVDSLKTVHSLHAYFLLVGDLEIPIIYHVHRVRDGNTFATRRIDAIQKRNVVFTMTASFQKEEVGFDHQLPSMPAVPDPESLSSTEELQEAHLTSPRLPGTYHNKVATTKVIHWPVEIRLCEHNNSTNYDKRPARSPIVHGSINKLSLLRPLQRFLRYWFRSNGKLSCDENLHRCVAAYTSDHITLNVSLNPHRRKGLKTSSASLCHSMWFHRPIKADEWLLFSVWSPTAYNARGLVIGHMVNRKGEVCHSLSIHLSGKTYKNH